jgi:hypothetical protein
MQGYEKIVNKKSINNGYLPVTIPEDASIIAFHFHSKKPMVGYRDRCIFHIYWFDRDFTLYDHGN